MRPAGTLRTLATRVLALAAATLALGALAAPLAANHRPLVTISSVGEWSWPAFTGTYWPASGVERQDMETAQEFLLYPPIRFSPELQVRSDRLESPSRAHLLGTDHLGRDLASRLLYGGRVSLGVGLLATLIALVLGITLGGLAGFGGGWADLLLSRVIEIFSAFPSLLLALTMIAFFPPGVLMLATIIGLSAWTSIARHVRAEALRQRERGFVESARASGLRGSRIFLRHLLPHILYVIVVPAAFLFSGAILAEAALSFIGLGVAEPSPSWGGVLALARSYLREAWWLALFPGLCLFVTLSASNQLGERLRTALGQARER